MNADWKLHLVKNLVIVPWGESQMKGSWNSEDSWRKADKKSGGTFGESHNLVGHLVKATSRECQDRWLLIPMKFSCKLKINHILHYQHELPPPAAACFSRNYFIYKSSPYIFLPVGTIFFQCNTTWYESLSVMQFSVMWHPKMSSWENLHVRLFRIIQYFCMRNESGITFRDMDSYIWM